MTSLGYNGLTHWGWVMHICISKLTIIGSDNGLLPGWCKAIIWTIARILLLGPLGTNISEIFNQNSYIFIQENAFENVVWKMAAILLWPWCDKLKARIWRHIYTMTITTYSWVPLKHVKYNIIFNPATIPDIKLIKTPHISPSQVSYGVSIDRI